MVVDNQEGYTHGTMDVLQRDRQIAEEEMTGLVQQSAVAGLPAIAREALAEKMREVGERMERLDTRLRDFQVTAANQEAYRRRVEEVRDWASTIADGLERLDYDGKRRVLFMLGVRVIVYRAHAPANDTERRGMRYEMETDFVGLNLGARLGIGYMNGDTNNNASNYGIVNALDMQALLGQSVGLGTPLTDDVQATIRERDGDADNAGGDAGGEGGAPSNESPTLWGTSGK